MVVGRVDTYALLRKGALEITKDEEERFDRMAKDMGADSMSQPSREKSRDFQDWSLRFGETRWFPDFIPSDMI